MPIPENAVVVLIPCQSCPREHFLFVDPDTRQVLDYDGARAPVRAGESLPAAFYRLFNSPCDECQRVWDLTENSSPAAWPTSAQRPTTTRTVWPTQIRRRRRTETCIPTRLTAQAVPIPIWAR